MMSDRTKQKTKKILLNELYSSYDITPREYKKMVKSGVVKLGDIVYKRSTRKNKKLMAKVPNTNKWIHFGSNKHEHFFDKTGLTSEKNHYDINRLKKYLQRHSKIKNKDNKLAINIVYSPAWFSRMILWNDNFTINDLVYWNPKK